MINIHNIGPKTLKDWLDGDEAVLIDVREVMEYKDCSIPNSKHLPLSQVNIDKAHLPEHRGKKLVFHCKSGKRSKMACQKLIEEGVNFDIWNLEGGIESWQTENLPIISTRNALSSDRQVMIAIGILILLGLTLHYFLQNQSYLILPLIAGIGLLNAGITGWCGLRKLIGNMPWNK